MAAGCCSALRGDDLITSTHRGHGHVLAKGAEPRRLMAELAGRETGLNRGRGGSMHAADLSLGVLGANGIVGAGAPIAVGAAWAAQQAGEDRVVACFFGDGAVNQGVLLEAFNLAAMRRLPVLFVCENNGYATTLPVRRGAPAGTGPGRGVRHPRPRRGRHGHRGGLGRRTGRRAGPRRGRAGIPGVPDLPVRRPPHQGAPVAAELPPPEEVESWRARDPLLSRGCGWTAAARGTSTARWTRCSTRPNVRPGRPAPDPDGAFDHLYATGCAQSRGGLHGPALVPQGAEPRAADEMAEDPAVCVLGEDVGAGVAGLTLGLQDTFGPARVLDTPLSEQGFTGMAVGAALTGRRPVIEFQIPSLLFLVFEQLVNQAHKFSLMTGGQTGVPLTCLIPGSGSRDGWAGQHSDQPYGLFAHTGVKTVVPATPSDAYGLLRSAISDPDPVVFFAPAASLAVREDVTGELAPIPLGPARVHRSGTDVTVVAIGHLVHYALAVAEEVADRSPWRCWTRARCTPSTGRPWPPPWSAPAAWS